MFLFTCLILSLILLWSQMASVDSPPRPVCVLVGDSLTQQGLHVHGWASLLGGYWARKVDLIHRGFSGYTSQLIAGIRNHACATTMHPVFYTLLLGSNDAALPPSVQHVPLPQFQAHMQQLVSHMTAGGAQLLLITPPPVHEAKLTRFNADKGRPLDRTNERTGQYAEVVRQIGRNMHIPVVDLYRALGGDKEEEDREKFLEDGLHLSEEGNRVLFELIIAKFSNSDDGIDLSKWRADVLPMDQPYWLDAIKAL